jgi:microcystin-dependent protein
MGSPYIGEIRLFAGNFAPQGWEFCSGQLLAIAENNTLFALIGTTYGGDGQSTFALPDLRGRAPIHRNGSFLLGQSGGQEVVTLTAGQTPAHTHGFSAAAGAATSTTPGGMLLATAPAATVAPYGSDAPASTLAPQSLSAFGGSQPHENMQPFLAISFIISLFGIFPSQS